MMESEITVKTPIGVGEDSYRRKAKNIVIGNGSIEGWLVIEGQMGQRLCKQTIGLVLLARFHYVIHYFPGELSQE